MSSRVNCTRPFRIALVVSALPLCWLMSACAQETNGKDAAAEVLAIQAERFRAIVDADVEALDRILATDLVYTHSHGGVDSKADFLQSLASGAVDYLELTASEPLVRVYQATAVVNGDVDLRVEAGGQQHQLSMRFTEVYVYDDKRWQLVAWQSTQIP